MELGALVFVRGKGWIAWLIKRITKSRYSHVAIYVGNGELIEAQGGRTVGYAPLSKYGTDFDTVDLPKNANVAKGLAWLFAQNGRHYSYWTIFVILVKKVLGLQIPWREGKDIICSRLARDYLYESDVPIPDTEMSPEDDYEWLKLYTS